MKHLNLLIIFLFFYSFSFAQLDVKFLNVPGVSNNAQIFSFINLANGNDLIAISQATSAGNSFLIETDNTGNYISSTCFPQTIDEVKLCSDDGLFILFNDHTIMKTDSALNISWTKKISPLNSSYSLIGLPHIAELDGYYYFLTSMEDSVFNPNVGILSTYDLVLFKYKEKSKL